MTKHAFSIHFKKTNHLTLSLVVVVVAIVGTISLVISHAATPIVSITANSGTLSGAASVITDSTASDGRAVEFGSGGSGTTTPTGVPAGLSPGSTYIGLFSGMSASQQTAAIALMKADGVKYIRIDTGCSYSNDTMMQDAEQAGITVDALLLSPCNGYTSSSWASFATTTVDRLRLLGVHLYEVDNEPNCNNVTAQAYTSALQGAYPAIKAADPSAFVLAAGLCPAGGSNEPYTYLTAMYAAGVKGYFDAANDHPYSFPDTPLQTGDSWNPWSYLTQLHTIMADNGDGNKQIWLTEFGCPTGTDGGYPADCTDTTEGQQITDAFQSARQLSFIGPLFVYSWQDSDSGDGDFGLYNANGTAKQPTLSDFISAAQ